MQAFACKIKPRHDEIEHKGYTTGLDTLVIPIR